jgi:hypothetical protein
MVPRRSRVQREDLLINICQATARASAVFISQNFSPDYFGKQHTVKVRLLESIFTRYMALFKVPWCLALKTSLKRPRQETCHS